MSHEFTSYLHSSASLPNDKTSHSTSEIWRLQISCCCQLFDNITLWSCVILVFVFSLFNVRTGILFKMIFLMWMICTTIIFFYCHLHIEMTGDVPDLRYRYMLYMWHSAWCRLNMLVMWDSCRIWTVLEFRLVSALIFLFFCLCFFHFLSCNSRQDRQNMSSSLYLMHSIV